MLDLSTLRVGRIDNPNPNPEQMLLAAEANVQQFRDYWQTRKMTLGARKCHAAAWHSAATDQTMQKPTQHQKC